MVTPDGRVKIMDFGLARSMQSDGSIAQANTIVGTTHYMSPEQIQGEPLDRRTDIFSLGVVFYEMLSGQLPFSGDYELAVLYTIVHAEPASLDELNPTIPGECARIVGRCLQKSKHERYASCDKILSDLNSFRQARSLRSPQNIEPPAGGERGIFIGRTTELGLLRRLMQGTHEGKGTTAFITGEAGIGKSRFLAAVAEEARTLGTNVFTGKCLFKESGLPYHPFASALKTNFQNFDLQVLDALAGKSPGFGINLAGRLPLIRSFLNLTAESSTAFHKEQLWDAVMTLFQVIAADRPVLLALDDLQWADSATVGLFSYIARSISNLKIFLIGIYRPLEGVAESQKETAGGAEMIRQLHIERLAEHIDFRRFSEEESGVYVTELFDRHDVDPVLRREIYKRTDGNPLFISEMVNLLKSQQSVRYEGNRWQMVKAAGEAVVISGRLHEVLLQRIDRLAKDEHELLELASCEGEYFHSDTLGACLHLDRISVLKRLQSLEKTHGLIRHEQHRYRFDHPLVRQVLYENILDELREEYHRMIAAWMIDRHKTHPEFDSRIAYHLIASGQEEPAISYLLRAADRAKGLCAHEEAMTYYRQARDILDRAGPGRDEEIMAANEGLGDAFSSLGRTQEGLLHYEQLLRGARTSSNRLKEIEALRKAAENTRIIGDIAKAMMLCREALALAVQLDDARQKVFCLNSLAFIHMALGEYDKTIELSTEALTLAETLADQKQLSQSLCYLGSAHLHQGNYRLSIQRLESARVIQEAIGDKQGLATTLNFAGLSYHRLGQYEKALSYHTEALEIKKHISDYPAIPGSLNNIGEIYRDIGDIQQAITYHKDGLALSRGQNNRAAECDNLRDLGAEYLLAGDLARSLQHLEEVLQIAKTHGYVWYETRSYITLTELHLSWNNLKEAEYYSELAEQFARRLNAKELMIEALWCRANVLGHAGAIQACLSLMDEALRVAELSEHRIFLWQMYWDKYRLAQSDNEAKRKAQQLVSDIVEGFQDEEMKSTFLHSKKVVEVLGSS
jgi:predicted ATPase